MKMILASVFLFFLLLSCSADEAKDEEKSGIGKATDKVAAEMVEKIQKPIDAARSVREAEEQRTKQEKKQIE